MKVATNHDIKTIHVVFLIYNQWIPKVKYAIA
jgi:hypothetical protein